MALSSEQIDLQSQCTLWGSVLTDLSVSSSLYKFTPIPYQNLTELDYLNSTHIINYTKRLTDERLKFLIIKSCICYPFTLDTPNKNKMGQRDRE